MSGLVVFSWNQKHVRRSFRFITEGVYGTFKTHNGRIVKEETVFDKHDNNQFSCKSHLLFHFSAARLERHKFPQ